MAENNQAQSESSMSACANPAAETTKPSRRLRIFSAALAMEYCVIFAVVGQAGSAHHDVFGGLNSIMGWRMTLVDSIRLGWILPGVFPVSILLILKDRWVLDRIALRINNAAGWLLLSFFLFWLYAVAGSNIIIGAHTRLSSQTSGLHSNSRPSPKW
jgi:hypothetical protein